MSDVPWTNENINEWRGGGGDSIFCPCDIWEVVRNVPGWRLQSARSEWPWHINGSQNRDIYLQFVYLPISSYNEEPFGYMIPFDHKDPRDRDDHQHIEQFATDGKVLLWSERGDNSCGVIFIVFTPNQAFIDLHHYGKEPQRDLKEQTTFFIAEQAVLQGS